MRGIIFLWFGSIVSIPDGWALCDGAQGTPDLRNRFVAGAGLTYDPGDGNAMSAHRHTFTGDGHAHSITYAEEIEAGDDYSLQLPNEPAIGSTGYVNAWPPYHALCYIMKLP